MQNFRVKIVTVAAIAGAAVGGATLANAASQTTSTTPSTTIEKHANFPAHGTAAHESAEKAVSGSNASKAQAAAVKAAGGGTAGDVVNDRMGTGYEVVVKKANGSQQEIHLDSSFAVMNHGGGPNDRN